MYLVSLPQLIQVSCSIEHIFESVWQFYAVQTARISTIRTGVLLRVLVVDAQPFQSLLQRLFEPFGSWELR